MVTAMADLDSTITGYSGRCGLLPKPRSGVSIRFIQSRSGIFMKGISGKIPRLHEVDSAEITRLNEAIAESRGFRGLRLSYRLGRLRFTFSGFFERL